jgi:Flp pilus assembly protein TadD
LRLTPDDWRVHALMGNTLWRQNNLEGALEEFRTAVRLAPLMAEVHYFIAGVLIQQGNRDEAVREYRETLRLNPRFSDARSALDVIESRKP